MPERVDLPIFPHGMADAAAANRWALVIVNVLGNASDAMPDGGIIVLAGQEDVVAPDKAGLAGSRRVVCVSVTDRGDGMDEETLARATEPFFTAKGVRNGTGLGVPMAHGLRGAARRAVHHLEQKRRRYDRKALVAGGNR
jgi:signal transduction histidine kinase